MEGGEEIQKRSNPIIILKKKKQEKYENQKTNPTLGMRSPFLSCFSGLSERFPQTYSLWPLPVVISPVVGALEPSESRG